jgi:hypothetical protein
VPVTAERQRAAQLCDAGGALAVAAVNTRTMIDEYLPHMQQYLLQGFAVNVLLITGIESVLTFARSRCMIQFECGESEAVRPDRPVNRLTALTRTFNLDGLPKLNGAGFCDGVVHATMESE